MVAAMPEDHRRFLVGFKRGEPDWALLGIPEAQHLPAVMWKQRNLAKLDTSNNPIAGDLMGIFEYGAGALDVMAVLVP